MTWGSWWQKPFENWGDGLLTVALLVVAGIIVLIALFAESKILKAVALGYVALPI
jgi:hypothetical protein